MLVYGNRSQLFNRIQHEYMIRYDRGDIYESSNS